MDKYSFLLFIFLISVACHLNAQHRIGITANLGVSGLEKVVDETLQFDRVEKWGPSFNLGFLYDYILSDNFSLMTEAKYSMLMNSSTYTDCAGCGNPLIDPAFYETTETDMLHYVVVPVSIGYRYKSLLLKSGFQYGIEIYSAYRIERQEKFSASQGNNQFVVKGDYDFKNDWGLLFGIIVFTGDKTAVSLNYYHGINNICNCEESEVEFRNKQITLGFNYFFNTGE